VVERLPRKRKALGSVPSSKKKKKKKECPSSIQFWAEGICVCVRQLLGGALRGKHTPCKQNRVSLIVLGIGAWLRNGSQFGQVIG